MSKREREMKSESERKRSERDKASAKMYHIQRALFPFCVIYFTCNPHRHTRVHSLPRPLAGKPCLPACLALDKTNSVRVYTQNQTLKDSSARAQPSRGKARGGKARQPRSSICRCCQPLHMHTHSYTYTGSYTHLKMPCNESNFAK